ncbi:MAG: 4-hydroxy-tetrahydrodipicolinate reductase [Rhodanobacter sp.]
MPAAGQASDAAAVRPLRIAVNGAGGRMGRALCTLLAEDRRFVLAHAVLAAGAAQVGSAVYAGATAPLFSAGWGDAPTLDVVVDFSSAQGLRGALAHCLQTGAALVTGTTGCDAALQAQMDAASARIALLHAANFSLGVAVLTRLVREAAAALPGWDAEIVEVHHAAKRDAPSGTALALGQVVAQSREAAASPTTSLQRSGARVAGSIGYAVVRGGDIVGEHTVMLIGQGERLELTHRASDRSVFARGALHAAYWLGGRDAGAWSLDDVLAAPCAPTL